MLLPSLLRYVVVRYNLLFYCRYRTLVCNLSSILATSSVLCVILPSIFYSFFLALLQFLRSLPGVLGLR